MALSVGHRTKRQGRTEAFWAVERLERYRLCAELMQVAGHLVIVCRSQADAARVASELSRHGVPAASVDHRDFAQPHVRAQVVTDETALMCVRNAATCLVQFDPAAGPRRYRRRIDLLAAPQAFVVTFVVPERTSDTRVLLDNLDMRDVIAGADMAVARRALASPDTSRASEPVLAATAGFAYIRRLLSRARRCVGCAAQRLTRRDHRVMPIRAGVADEAAFGRGRQAS